MPELGGHAIAEFPLHLIGHSRGGSLICELSRQLGANGVWVDHVNTLDPHPLNDPAFPLDAFLYDAVDAPANTYQTVLYADNYWQDISSVIRGKAVSGLTRAS
jgi:thioesterase domain-containing protein